MYDPNTGTAETGPFIHSFIYGQEFTRLTGDSVLSQNKLMNKLKQ